LVKEKNSVLHAIKERRSITQFKPGPIHDEKLESILEAGRWAPSWTNSQPWKFIVVKDEETKQKLTETAVTITGMGIEEAPLVIVVVTDIKSDPYHYVEDAAAATQNMALAAHSLGLNSFWVGVFDISGEKGASEDQIRKILEIPESYRVISMLPIGIGAFSPIKNRKPLSEIVYRESFGKN